MSNAKVNTAALEFYWEIQGKFLCASLNELYG